MFDSLDNGRPLRACREALSAAGHPWQLLTGTRVFVRLEQYRAVMRALNGQSTFCWHVVVAESFEYLVEEILAELGNGAWARSRTSLALEGPGTPVGTVS